MKYLWVYISLFWITTTVYLVAEASQPEPLPLHLHQAVQEALRNNLGLKLIKEDKEAALAASQIQQGIFDAQLVAEGNNRQTELTATYPGAISEDHEANWQTSINKRLHNGTQLDLSWQNTRTSNDLTLNTIEPAYSSTLFLTINQPLLQGFGKEAQLAALQAAEKKQQQLAFEVDSQAANLAAQVKNAYWQLVFAKQDIKVKQLSLQLAKQLRDETQEKIKAGSLAEMEIYQPESEVARREQLLIGAERAIGLAQDALKLLLNRDNWQQPLSPIDLPPITVAQPDLNIILDRALAQRPDLQAAKLQMEAARLHETSARDKTLPSLSLSGGVGISGVDDSYGQAIDGLATKSDTSWQVGVVFTKPLGNNLAQGQHRVARANLNRSRTQTALLGQAVQQQVRQAVRDVQLAIKTVDATSKTSLATQKRLEAQQAKFKVGLATTYDVLVAQEAYAQSLANENLSKVQLAAASAEIDRIQGRISLDTGQ